LKTPHARELFNRVSHEYDTQAICPSSDKLFSAFHACPPTNVKVVILGQDPYFNRDQATGMSFSINPMCGCMFPPSLRNIITEVKMEHDGKCACDNGDLTPWAHQGVLLLNTCLTVRMGMALSHANIGWDGFTRAVISTLNKMDGVVFMLWGAHAKKYGELLNNPKNLVLTSAHPSPLSAHGAKNDTFAGNGHFKKANEFLTSIDKVPVTW